MFNVCSDRLYSNILHTYVEVIPICQSLLVGGSEEQKQRYLPRMSTGEISGSICVAERRT